MKMNANTTPIDWNARRAEQREIEWHLRCRVAQLIETLLDRWQEDPQKAGTLEALAKHVELVSKLGRLALDAEASPAQAGLSEEFLLSLMRVNDSDEQADSSRPAKEGA